MGTSSAFMITPYGSLIVGFFMGIISTFGYLFITVSLIFSVLFVFITVVAVTANREKRKRKPSQTESSPHDVRREKNRIMCS